MNRFIIGPLIIVAAFAWLVATGIRSNTLRAVPVHELRAADGSPHSFVGQRLRVVGYVAPEKVRVEPVSTTSGMVNVNHFAVVDKGQRVAVEYRDALPDTFKPGGPVQVDGVYGAPGLINAEHVLTKCPSKYESTQQAKDMKAAAKSKGSKDAADYSKPTQNS